MTRYALLLLATGLLAAGPKEDATRNDLKKLEGTWHLESGVNDGKKLSAERMKGSRLTFTGEKHVAKVGDATYAGTHKLDATVKPKTIDIMDTEGPFKGKTVRGIYELDGDTFTICYAPDGGERPKEFSATAGSGHRYHIWKRDRK